MITPRGVDLEIVEKTDSDTGIVVPNCVRINGMEVLAPKDYPPVVHQIDMAESDYGLVTLTLFVRKLTISAVPPQEESTPIYDQLASQYL